MPNSSINDTLAGYLANCESDAAAHILAGMQMQSADPTVINVEGVPHLVTPIGKTVTSMEELLDKPRRLKSHTNFNEPQSFCNYVNHFNTAKTARIYADFASKKIHAFLDDHQPGEPNWRNHAATLDLKLSPEWLDWTQSARGTTSDPMDQQELAEFFESHIRQIAEPDSSDLLSGIRNVQMANNWKCTSAQREGGDISFSMQRESSASTSVGDKTDVKIPSRLTLLIYPFLCWNLYPLKVMLTYRLKDEKIRFTMKLLEVNELLDKAFIDIRAHIEKEIGIPVLL